jgi:hypothetical protein
MVQKQRKFSTIGEIQDKSDNWHPLCSVLWWNKNPRLWRQNYQKKMAAILGSFIYYLLGVAELYSKQIYPFDPT